MFNPQLTHGLSEARQGDLRRAEERSRNVAIVRSSRRSLVARLLQIPSRVPRPAQPTAEMVPSHAGR
jgi:hypothetical protein